MYEHIASLTLHSTEPFLRKYPTNYHPAMKPLRWIKPTILTNVPLSNSLSLDRQKQEAIKKVPEHPISKVQSPSKKHLEQSVYIGKSVQTFGIGSQTNYSLQYSTWWLIGSISPQTLHVLHICAFLQRFLGSNLTAGTIFHSSWHCFLHIHTYGIHTQSKEWQN